MDYEKDVNFKTAFNFTEPWEGGYVNDPDDPGEETYKGISRKHHPKWEGWKIIDAANKEDLQIKTAQEVFTPKQLKKLNSMVRKFYFNKYWLNAECDRLDFPLAMVIFDSAVNCGIKRSVRWLQRAFNEACAADGNNGGIKEDGIFGPITYNSVHQVDQSEILTTMVAIRVEYYTGLAEQEWAEKYFHGWMRRAVSLRKYSVKQLKKLNKN